MQNFLWFNLYEVQKLAKLVIKVRRVEAFGEGVMVIKTRYEEVSLMLIMFFFLIWVSATWESISLKIINLCLVICLH